MKKEFKWPLTIAIAALLLAGCSSKSTTSTSTTSQASTTSSTTSTSSSTDTSSSTEPTTISQEMDLTAISQGDYSSVTGTWQNSAGNTLVFDATGLISDGVSLSQTGTLSDGVYETTVSATSGVGGFGLVMIPKGTEIPSKYLTEGSSDTTDSSKDRMFTAQGVIDGDAVDAYYRVSDSTDSSTDPLKDTNTGVTLESGQVTLDYAISILGDKSWVAIESNYNRTESIPFELLQGNDGSLYRIYQNGVIVEDTQNQIVYQP